MEKKGTLVDSDALQISMKLLCAVLTQFINTSYKFPMIIKCIIYFSDIFL